MATITKDEVLTDARNFLAGFGSVSLPTEEAVIRALVDVREASLTRARSPFNNSAAPDLHAACCRAHLRSIAMA